jgi:hypothetical protein
MSRSNQTELVNPAVRFFDWAGATGEVTYFDKTRGENGERVAVDLPFRFLILDKMTQVTGGVERYGKYEGFWSNAIRSTELKTRPLVVRSKQGVECQGLYEQIKGHHGVKFMTGLYIAFYDENEHLQIGYLKLKGAALTAWIEFTKPIKNVYDGAFSIVGRVQKKKGATTYYEPEFKHTTKLKPETEESATALDRDVLQPYLTAYFAQQQEPEQSLAAAAGVSGNGDYSGDPHLIEPPMPEFDPSDDDIPF